MDNPETRIGTQDTGRRQTKPKKTQHNTETKHISNTVIIVNIYLVAQNKLLYNTCYLMKMT
jgi:hypothetical protein